MVQPPTPEGFAGGLANGEPPWGNTGSTPPGGRRGRRDRPAIGVDPNTVTLLGRVREAMRTLKGEVKGLADEAERYARAMGTKASGLAGGGRPANMPEPMRRQQERQEAGRAGAGGVGGIGGRGGGGGGRFEGGLSGREEFIVSGLARDLAARLVGQIGQVAQRESSMTRIGMALPGQYQAGGIMGVRGTSGRLQAMARQEAYGYRSTSELYSGIGGLQEYGLLTGDRGRDAGLLREASLAGRVSGLGFGAGAEMMQQFRNPAFVNQMQQYGITSPFQGGRMQMFGGQGLMEQLYGRMGGAGADWNKIMTPGSQQRTLLESMGMAPEQMRTLQQYGAARQEGVGADDTQELERRFKDTGESMRELQQASSQLMDTLATGLVPIIKGLNAVLRPVVDWFEKINDRIPLFGEAIGAAMAAIIAFTAATWTASKVRALGGGGGGGMLDVLSGGGRGGKGGRLGRLGGRLASRGGMVGRAGGLIGRAGPLVGKLGRGIGVGLLASLGGDIAQGLIGGEQGSGRDRLGGAIGGAARGAGLGAMVGSVIPGVGTAIGAGVGGVVGGGIGLITNWGGDDEGEGDAWPLWMRDGVGDSDATPKEPTKAIASGLELPGAKAGDQNMNPEFVKRLAQMFADNPKLTLTSGWRDSAEQARLYREKPHLAAPPGRSNHERGTAADLGPQSQWAWIGANLGKYGLFLPMPPTAARRAAGKKIEPWHVEPVGLTGSVPPQGTTATGAPAEATPAGGGAKPKPKSPELATASANVGVGGGGYSEAGRIQAAFGGTQIGDAWEGMGDNEVTYVGTQVSPMGGSRGRGTTISIGSININLTIARGTPEEAERTARYLGSLLGDRDRMLELARNGGRG